MIHSHPARKTNSIRLPFGFKLTNGWHERWQNFSEKFF